jgi:hypothetical protein
MESIAAIYEAAISFDLGQRIQALLSSRSASCLLEALHIACGDGEMTAGQAMYFRFGGRRKRLPAGVKKAQWLRFR